MRCCTAGCPQLLELRNETNAVVDFIPELKAYCASFQDEIASVVAKHGDIQFVFEHYVQVRLYTRHVGFCAVVSHLLLCACVRLAH